MVRPPPRAVAGPCISPAFLFCAIQWSMSLQPAVLLSRIWTFSVYAACFLGRRDCAFLVDT